MFLSTETGMLGNFLKCKGCQVPFRISRGNVGFLLRRCSRKGPHLTMTGEPRGFSRVAVGSRVMTGNSSFLLCWPREVQCCIRIARESWGLLSSHCRANRPNLSHCPENLCSSPMATGISCYIQGSPGDSGLVSSGSKEFRSPLQLPRVSLGAHRVA